MTRPRSLAQFQTEFPDEAACAEFLIRYRWPAGFYLPDLRGLSRCPPALAGLQLRMLGLRTPDIGQPKRQLPRRRKAADGMRQDGAWKHAMQEHLLEGPESD